MNDQNGIATAITASLGGDVETLQRWLQSKNDPNQYDAEGWTPLLAAAVRGQAEAVAALLDNPMRPADSSMRHKVSDALPIHFAGHSGSVAVAEKLLASNPEHLEEAWLINGHTLLLQAVFYGHAELSKYALSIGANTAATTLRGLTAMGLMRQFQNQPMIDLLLPYDSPPEASAAYFQKLLERVKPIVSPDEEDAQKLADDLVATIEEGLRQVAGGDNSAVEGTLARVQDLVENKKADVNRLGGILRQPPLIVVVTGNNGSPANPNTAELRKRLAEYLLNKDASPITLEHHPMGVHSIIRAAVFNHLDILKMMGEHLTPEQLAKALNDVPIVNGLTALHDSVLRASMVGADRIEGYLEQIRWAVSNGANYDMEDFSGRTQRKIAESVADAERRSLILEALGIRS